MSNANNEKKFFGLDSSDKAKIVRKAADLAKKDQLNLVNRYGGIQAIGGYCKTNQ